MTISRRHLGCLIALALGTAAGSAAAQAPMQAPPPRAASATAPQPAPQLSAETRTTRGTLDTIKVELDQQRAATSRQSLSQQDLQDLRARIEPLGARARVIVADVAPKVDAARARLEQLGTKPKDAEESADVARDRADRESSLAEFDETGRLARALVLDAEQLSTEVSDRRRTLFTQALFERNAGLAGGGLWAPALQSLPGDLAAIATVGSDVGRRFIRDASPTSLTLLALTLGVAFALHVGRQRLAPRIVHRDPRAIEPPRRAVLFTALCVLLVEALPAAIGALLVYGVVDGAGLVPLRIMPALISVLAGIAFVAFVRALAEALLAPDLSPWRIVKLGDAAALRTYRFAIGIAALIALAKFVESLYQVIAAALPLTVLTRGLIALAVAATIGELLRRFATSEDDAADECLGPYIPTEPEVGGPARMLGWVVVAAIVIAALAGYVAFASFLVDQFAWTSILLSLLVLAVSLTDEFVCGSLTGQSLISTALQANTGLRRKSLQQIGILLGGILRVVLILVAALLALAPWGVESTDILSSVRAAFFGFKVGDVTVSLSTIVFAIVIFGIGFVATRVVQRWLETTFLPTTELDAGLRNSIATAFGYFGFFAATATAFSYLGLGLDKIAIVAGALSVGIGFGLQSIVNNFVSGLILLWERPIRVGDLVVVGDGEGHVRRISVRATEIETADRSTVIVPNSNLISGVVRNRVRSDRSGRVVIPVNVLRNQDPARAAQLLVDCAKAHADIMPQPEPSVIFKKIGDTNLEFELVSFVADVNDQVRVQSELNFAVFERLVREGFIPPLGPGATTILGLDPVRDALDHIAEALDRDEAAPAPEPRSRAG